MSDPGGLWGQEPVGWQQDVIHGFTETGADVVPVTLKEKIGVTGDVTDALIAPGHIGDIQPGIDHVHAWDQNTTNPGSHDLRDGPPLFPL